MGGSGTKEPEPRERNPLDRGGGIEENIFNDAAEATAPIYLRMLPRCKSVDLENDPRIFHANVIGKRFSAFSSVSVGATLVASLSLTTAAGVENMARSWPTFIALSLMLLVFVMNIFTVLVITQQYYQIHRLQTCSANGFDIAKSYYMNSNIIVLRHAAVKSFFWSLILYVFAVGTAAYAKMRDTKPIMAHVTIVLLVIVGFYLGAVMRQQRIVFDEKIECIEKFKKPLRDHMASLRGNTYSSDELKTMSGHFFT